MRPLHLALVWHLHQPYHKDDVSGTTLLPWVRLRATKDYRKLAVLLAERPGLRQTFNLVPSLLVQLEDHARGGGEDLFLRVSRKPAEDLSAGERAFVVRWLRESTRLPRVRASSRYAELAARAEHDPFSIADLRDLQVWANLAWCGPHWVDAHPALSQLRARDRDFSEEDKQAVLDAMAEEAGRVIPAYRALARDGRAELTCSPLCHPILPLLVDLESAREGTPGIELPEVPFRHPEDAARHVRAGRDYVERVMGVRPRGLWPPELAVDGRVERLVGETGLEWMVADEGVLARSLRGSGEHDARQVADPELLYRPAHLAREGRPVSLVFRDTALSSLVGFDYPRMAPAEAAQDFLARLRRVRDLQGENDFLVTVALDGASPWDWYPREGQDFLEALFDELERADDIVSTTVGEFLDQHPHRQSLPRLHAGSWIGAALDTWVGGAEHNRAWDQLARARQAVAEHAQASSPRPGSGESAGGVVTNGSVEPNTVAAWRELMIAEGSDWFWWYSRRRSSGMDPYWDGRFRLHLRNAYRLLGEPPPPDLFGPGLEAGGEPPAVEGWRPPTAICSPRSRGDPAWDLAGWLEASCGERAPRRPPELVDRILIGCDLQSLHVRLDGPQSEAQRREWDVELWVYLSGEPAGPPAARVLDAPLGPDDREDGAFLPGTVLHVGGSVLTVCRFDGAGARPVVQRDLSDPWCFTVPFSLLGRVGGERVQLRAVTARQGRVVDELPFRGAVDVVVPYEAPPPPPRAPGGPVGAGAPAGSPGPAAGDAPAPDHAASPRGGGSPGGAGSSSGVGFPSGAGSPTEAHGPGAAGEGPGPLRVLLAAAGVAPFAAGRAGEAAADLARTLQRQGHDVRLLLPRHGSLGDRAAPVARLEVPLGDRSIACTVLQTRLEGVTAYLIDCPALFDRPQLFGYPDDETRFAGLCRAIVELLLLPAGFVPDVLHVHDWPLALVPGLLEEARGRQADLGSVATVLTVHRPAGPGRGAEQLAWGIRRADVVATVSAAPEMEDVLAERGDSLLVSGGIDPERFDPGRDEALAAPFSAEAPGGKALCRSALRRELGLDDDPRAPLIAYLARFLDRNGAGLVEGLLPHLDAARAQVAILGAGEPWFERRFQQAAARWPARVAARVGFEEGLARRLLAGADLLLLPGRPEPGGLLHLLGLRYGALPITRPVDAVQHYDPLRDAGNGFVLAAPDPWEVFGAVVRASETYRHVRVWSGLVRRALAQDVSLERTATHYVELYRAALEARRGQGVVA